MDHLESAENAASEMSSESKSASVLMTITWFFVTSFLLLAVYVYNYEKTRIKARISKYRDALWENYRHRNQELLQVLGNEEVEDIMNVFGNTAQNVQLFKEFNSKDLLPPLKKSSSKKKVVFKEDISVFSSI